ncbi:MAG: OPT family oligopeptide transporter [Gemmataceae bacterium]
MADPSFTPSPLAGRAPADSTPEFTLRALVVGTLLGLVFGASSLYLVLRVGMTVSASIPVAVLAITVFRGLWRALGLRPATILENNITQTAGSAGESIAFGVGVTMPALLLIGFEMTIERIMVVSLLGGVLGILMMIPLRRVFIVAMHGELKYPEGTACAAVLKAGEDPADGAKGPAVSGSMVFLGFGLAFAHKFITEGMTVLRTTVAVPLGFYSKAATVASDMASELLGVGYIIGVRTSAVMMAGAVLGGLVIAPTIFLEGEKAGIKPGAIYKDYLRFIGAGCVAAAGILSMMKTLPLIVRSIFASVGAKAAEGTGRTERDLPPAVVLGGCAALLGVLTVLLNQQGFGWVPASLAAGLVLLFGFLFVTVSSRLTGEIGSSSNPISGMTVATLLLTCVIFLVLGMRGPGDAALAITIGAVVCIAASNGGTTSQDLKTGFLVGGTPLWQQLAIVIGAVVSAVVIGFTLLLLNATGTVYSQRDLPTENLASKLDTMTETETYQGETFHVHRPLKGKKYLVDAKGGVAYLVDPTITGTLVSRDTGLSEEGLPDLRLTPDALAKLGQTFSRREGGKVVAYRIFVREEPLTDADRAKGAGRDKDTKAVEYLVDGTGRAVARIETEAVKMKFDAPKTQVMGLIVNGLLDQKLNWGLVLIGSFIAVSLELCGISSLAFAVGLYIPMQYSAPIFTGGLVRWGVDSWNAPPGGGERADEAEEITKTETSSGVLLASGLIAGGSLAGVAAALLDLGTLPGLEFLTWLKNRLNFSIPSGAAGGGTEPKFAFMADRATFGDLDYLALGVFAALAVLLFVVGTRGEKKA